MAKVNLRTFNYKKMGELDADMWQAYYNHQFFRLFWLLLLLMREQVHQNWFTTVRLAYYSAWAAADYRIHRKQVKRTRVLKNITKFYKLVSASATEPFDYVRVAELELAWWDMHRQSASNNPALEDSLAVAAACMYDGNPVRFKQYAHLRAEAMIMPHHTGDRTNTTDWPRIKELTIQSWQSLHTAVQIKDT